MKTTSRILINSISSYLAVGGSIAINIILIPYVIKYLGKEVYGLVAVAQSLQVIISLSGSGMGQAMCRYFSLNYAKEDAQGLQAYYTNAVTITVGILSPIVVILMLILIFFVVPYLDISPGMTSAVTHLLILLGGFSLSYILASPYMALCATAQKFYLQHICTVTGQVICLAVVLIVLPFKPILAIYGMAYLVGGAANLILLYFIGKYLFPYCKFLIRQVSMRRILSIFSVSTQVLLPAISSSVYSYGNQIIVNIFLGPVYNTYLAVCLVWERLVWSVMNAVGSVIAPQITTYQAKGQWDMIGKSLLRITKYSALIGLPLSGVLAILADPILTIWIGQRYEISIKILPWFALGLVFLACQMPASSMLIALGKFRIPGIMALIVAFCNLAGVLIFVGWFKFGLEAIAILIFSCNCLRLGLFQTWYVAKQCHRPLPQYVLNAYLRPLISFLPSIVILFVAREAISDWSALLLVTVIGLAAAVYVPCFWFVSFDAWDKDLVKYYLSSLKNKLFKKGRKRAASLEWP